MEKQRIALGMLIFSFLFTSLVLANQAQAGASATVSWTPPTTDQGGGALTGLTGYRVYYSTTSRWLGMVGECLLGLGSSVDVDGGATASYHFPNNLNPGSTYYFTVVATDGTNSSYCATGGGGVTEVSKRVTYSGDIQPNNAVDIFDYNLLKTHYGTSNSAGDVDQNGTVNIFDYNILKADYGLSFS